MNKATLLLLLPAFFQVARAAAEGSYYSNSYNDCLDLQNLFDYTIKYDMETEFTPDVKQQFLPYSTGESYQEYELVSCNFPGTCPDGVTRNTCTWQRVTAFFCDMDDNDDVLYTVFTNSLPNHCYYAENNEPLGNSNYYNVYAFGGYFNVPTKEMEEYMNTDSDEEFYYTEINSQTDLNIQLCDNEWAKHDNIDAAIDYSEYFVDTVYYIDAPMFPSAWIVDSDDYPLLRLPDSDQVVGVALNGVFLFSGTSDYGYDAFFPASYGNKKNPRAIEVDVCLGTSRTYSTYRYHMFSPCIYDVSLREVAAPCDSEDYPDCIEDVRQHALDHTPNNMKTLTPIGIAKDGRVIYGPYKGDGTVWQPCEVDVCNGVKFNKYYGYVSTMFHPYFVGCWGPGNGPKSITQQCSSNGRKCSHTYGSSASGLFASVVMVVASAFLAYF